MHTNTEVEVENYIGYTFVRTKKVNDSLTVNMYKPNNEEDFYKGHLVEVFHPHTEQPVLFFEKSLEVVLEEVKK